MITDMGPLMTQMAALVFSFIAFSAWIGHLMFSELDPEGFRDFPHAFFSMLVLMTTSNFPVMLWQLVGWKMLSAVIAGCNDKRIPRSQGTIHFDVLCIAQSVSITSLLL